MTSEISKKLPSLIGSASATIALKAWPFKPYIVIGGQNSSAGVISYSQVGNLVTVTHTAHGMTADLNGGEIFLFQGTGALLSAWFTEFTYVDANNYTCVSSISQTTSGNLGNNTAETVLPATYTVPSTMIESGVTMQLVYIRKYLGTFTKTIRTYFNSILIDALAQTTATTWGNTNSASQTFVSNTKYFSNGVSTNLETLTTPAYTSSVQCSDARTWIALFPAYINYTNRG